MYLFPSCFLLFNLFSPPIPSFVYSTFMFPSRIFYFHVSILRATFTSASPSSSSASQLIRSNWNRHRLSAWNSRIHYQQRLPLPSGPYLHCGSIEWAMRLRRLMTSSLKKQRSFFSHALSSVTIDELMCFCLGPRNNPIFDTPGHTRHAIPINITSLFTSKTLPARLSLTTSEPATSGRAII